MTPSESGILDWPVFIGVTLILAGFASFSTGRALAATWRPASWTVFYAALLGVADRFIHWALFDGELLSPASYAVDTACLVVIALVAYRLTRAGQMVRQYPWLYRRSGPFSWQPLAQAGPGEEIAKGPANLEKN